MIRLPPIILALLPQSAGVEQIIFLGGLAETTSNLSEHLRSRLETGNALRSAGIPVTEFRAGVIVGSGSISFEMIRYLTERVPVIIAHAGSTRPPNRLAFGKCWNTWQLRCPCLRALDASSRSASSEVITYGEMMMIYADVRGLKRWMVPVPVLTPRLSSYWVNLVTPIPAAIARPLIEGLRTESTVHDPIAQQLFPHIQPVDYRSSVERALAQLKPSKIDTNWTDVITTATGDGGPITVTIHEGMILEHHNTLSQHRQKRFIISLQAWEESVDG